MNTSFQVRSALFSVLGAALVMSACPKVPDPDPLPPAPVVISFSSSASVVDVGSKVTLSWKVENATSVKIEETSLGAVSGVENNEGSVEVSIGEDALFVLTARNDRGASDSAVVTVRTSAAAGELLFTALPSSIQAGESATLAWSAAGSAGLTITASPGGMLDLQNQGATGVLTVNPTATTTYTLSAGGRMATAVVTVQPSLLSFSASPTSARAGGTVTLNWATAGATHLRLTAPGRAPLVDEADPARIAAGTFEDTIPAVVDPGQLFPYELTITGAGQTLKRSVIVSVQGRPAVATFTGPAFVRSPAAGPLADGGTPAAEITLSWTTVESDAVTISAAGVEIYRAPASAVATGNMTLPSPAQTTTYQLTASDSRGGSATKDLTVEVRGLPTVTLTATPGSVTGGSPVTLSWTGQNIFNAQIRESTFGSVVFGSTTRADTGTARAAPNANVTYTFVADNGLGDVATSTADVTVTSPLSLTVTDTGALRAGQNVNVTWTVPTGTAPIIGLGHDGVDVRTTSTGFDDISTTGTKLTFSSEKASISTSFRTTLFGRTVGDVITVTDNGYLTFGILNGTNSVDVALPTAKIEPMSVAPYWESLTVGGGVFWQVKTVNNVQTLIVQWQATIAEFEAKIAATGQIDFEYRTLPASPTGHAGVVGARPAQTVVFPGTPAPNMGATFFGSRQTPVVIKAAVEGPIGGYIDLGGGALVRVAATLPLVVDGLDLSINEVMPASTRGVGGTWVELRNARDIALPLSGWSFSLSDGGAIPLSGTVPARSLLVVGASSDPLLNDDAGVQIALPGFDLTGESALTLARGGAHDSVSLAGADAGVAFTHDLGPYRYSGSTPAGQVRCITTDTYGAGTQRGTPGIDRGCGFGYAASSLSPGYHDISDGGTPHLTSSFDDVLVALDVSSAPLTFLGSSRTSLELSTNGFVSFDTASSSTTDYLSDNPSTSGSHTLVAAFAADLTGSSGTSQLYSKRLGAGEDPFAAQPHWIFQWHHFRRLGGSDDVNFQVKFFDDGTIEVHFDKMLSGSSDQYASGLDSVTSIINAGGTQALVLNANSATPGISPYSAFRFSPR